MVDNCEPAQLSFSAHVSLFVGVHSPLQLKPAPLAGHLTGNDCYVFGACYMLTPGVGPLRLECSFFHTNKT